MNLTLISQPYPFNSSIKRQILKTLLFGFFVFLFLVIFQPFGLQNYENKYKIIHFWGYGFITSVTMLISHLWFTLLFPKWYCRKAWTVGKNLIYIIWVFLAIGITNWAYSVYFNFGSFSFRYFFLFQSMTLLIGIFPVTIGTLIVYQKHLKNALKEAQILNQNISNYKPTLNKQIVEIPSKNKSENLKVELESLLYIKAMENYVEVCTVNKSIILRNTLKEVEKTLITIPELKRCHRSYLINLQKIKSFSGNAQGLSLRLDVKDSEEIPVSRSYVSQIKTAL